MSASPRDFYYSNKYNDDKYEYRHVHVPKDLVRLIPKDRLMSEKEWRSLGIQQSQGWVHYMIHSPERHFTTKSRTLKLYLLSIFDVVVHKAINQSD
ncbi:unnamed protein product [Acanthocheilonema viteae]|uniref:Cyclin-dependent kinases regulatory subunit n=1 Tax=Acanthocheilonema viteae TaxID=6277 RepID=A0A498SW61_ACAVI|nr:unnamed protein product [Acanthocheilonema viteae]